jgi:ABC-type lipoprotein export system ATPase subunit/GNAT superfamily N-acetyltransferase
MGIIKLNSKINHDKYTDYVFDHFDIQNRDEVSVEIPINLGEAKNFDWSVGVILGGSGSGKSTILNKCGGQKQVNFSHEKALISNFEWLEPKEAALILGSMGLSSVPSWLKPFHALSNGEKYRATLAYLVSSSKDGEVILIDEYTSVVDRDVAKAMSFALQKYIRKHKKRIIVASCHYDILEWLMPDWTYSLLKGGVVERHDYLRRGRPEIKLQVSRVEYSAWEMFQSHHYLTQEANKACKFLLYEWDGRPVAIAAVINQGGAGRETAVAISRLVVLPDYQGMGMGSKVCEFTAAIFKDSGACAVYIKTVNPALGEYMSRSRNWKPTSMNGKIGRNDLGRGEFYSNRLSRPSYCYEYIGKHINGYSFLLKPIKEMRNSLTKL